MPPQARWRLSRWSEEKGLVPGVAVTVVCLLQCAVGTLRAHFGFGRASEGLVCSRRCIRSATAYGGGGRSLPRATVLPPLAGVHFSRSYRPRNVEHGETTEVRARLWSVVAHAGWWQVWWSAMERPGAWFFGGREKSLSSRHRCGDAFSTPRSVSGETLGRRSGQQRRHRRSPSWRCCLVRGATTC